MRLSIRYKILGVLGLLLLLAVGFYTALASLIFREEKVALLYDINHSIAVNTAAQLRSDLVHIGEELRLFVLAEVLGSQSAVRLPAHFLSDAHVLGMRLYLKQAESYQTVAGNPIAGGTGTPAPLPTTATAAPPEYEMPRLDYPEEKALPHLKEAERSTYDFWSESRPDDTTQRFFLTYHIELNLAGQARHYLVLAEIDGKPIFRILESTNLFTSYLTRMDGNVLYHCERSRILPTRSIAGHPLLREAASHPDLSSGLLPFQDRGLGWYGAYAPLGIGNLVFLSQASEQEVENASRRLVQRSLLFGIIVLTLTFIASILFSKRLTRNLKALTDGARQIEKGDLDAQIRVRSHDEVQELASSFNAMTRALKRSREEIEGYNRELEAKVQLRTEQLHETNAAIKEVQEKLLKATQMATVGEVAGRTAHEVLNPLTAILNRLERSQGLVAPPTEGDALPVQFNQILLAWEEDFRRGGMDELWKQWLSASTVIPGQTLFEEDLGNLKRLADFWEAQSRVVAGDLEFVHEQAHRIHRIIDRMREFARSSVKTEVHCFDAIREAIVTMTDFLSKHHIRLEEEKKATYDLAQLNRDEFVQILTNLIRNSYHAINSHPSAERKQAGLIRVETSHDESGTQLWVDIVDNGIGIPPERQHHLFEQGFTTKSTSEGTGLGLAICRRYARAFGGEVELVYSEPESRGTCFRIRVPMKGRRPEAPPQLPVAV